MISLQQVSKQFQDGTEALTILDQVDWTLQPGESVALTGRSGCGKSTLLNLIGGLDRGFSGTIQVFDKDISKFSEKEIASFRNDDIGFVFQSFHLMDSLTCLENVLLPTWFSKKDQQLESRALELLEKVGLSHKIKQYPHRLSGGERQRIAIARSLIHKPSLLLCDEPTGNLDEATGEEILELFKTLHKEEKLSMLLVTHETRTAEIADRVCQLKEGKIIDGSELLEQKQEVG